MAKNEEKNILDETLLKIQREFGKGSIMRLGDRDTCDVDSISSGSILFG